MRTCFSNHRLFGALVAGLAAAPLTTQAASFVWDGTTDQNWTNGPQNTNAVTFPNNGSVGANWTIDGGSAGQIVTPDAGTPGGNAIDYLFSGHDWTINNATINEDVQIRLDGGSLNVTNSSVSLLPTSLNTGSSLSGLNLGQSGTPTTAVFTNSTLNFGRSNSGGNSFRLLNGSTLDVINSDISVTSETGSGTLQLNGAGASLTLDADSSVVVTNDLLLSAAVTVTSNGAAITALNSNASAQASVWLNAANAQFNMNGGSIDANNLFVVSGSNFVMNGGTIDLTPSDDDAAFNGEEDNLDIRNASVFDMQSGTINTPSIRINSGSEDVQDLMFNFVSGSITLSDPNPLRDSTGFEGAFDWTGDVGAGSITHTDLSANDNNLAGKVSQGFFAIDGVRVNPPVLPSLDWTDQTNIDTLNTELLALAVNGKYLEITQDLGLGTQTLTLATALIPGDTDGDGDVDDTDLGVMISGFTGPLSPAAVPEPTSLALLGLGGLLAVRRRRA